MSNAGLHAEVSALRSELSRVESENAALRREIGIAVGGITAGEATLISARGEVNQTLSDSNNSLAASHERVIRAHEIQLEMDAVYQRMKNMEAANKAIRQCNNTRYYDFEGYRKVRKIVQGMMDNMDFSMISEEVIERVVEKEHLQNPDYWLTAALIAIAAWKDDQRERADRAIARAMELDAKRCASFMLIFNLRIHREDAAFKWFDVLTQMPLTGSDTDMILLFFSLLSHTIEDNVSDAAHARVSSFMSCMVRDAIASSETTRSDAVSSIVSTMRTFARDRSFSYPAISAHAQISGRLRDSLVLARNSANVINFVNSIMTVDETVHNEYLKTYIDQIVDDPSDEERAVYDEIALNELIIKCQGDKGAARDAWAREKAHDAAELDIVGEMIGWVYSSETRSEANPQMRRNMLVLTKDLQQAAGDEYVKFYQGLYGPKTVVTINDYTGEMDLSRPAETMPAIEAFHRGVAEERKAQVKDTKAYIALGVSVAAGIALLFLEPALALLALVGLVVGGVMLLQNRNARKRIDLECENSIKAAANACEALGAEWVALDAEWHREDLLSADLYDALASL